MSVETKKNIESALKSFAGGNLTRTALSLFETLGYDTSRQASLPKPTMAEFKASFAEGNPRFSDEKALCKEWKYVDMLFQLSKDEVTRQHSLFDTKQVDRTIIQAYLFFVIEVTNSDYSRTALSQITREVNKLFPMPAMILFKHGAKLTLAIINRRLHKKDETRDVLEKVTVIKDISIEKPHPAHVLILLDLSFNELLARHSFTNFVELHAAWQKTLDTKELNKRFYQQLASWYFWAKEKVSFPADIEKDDDKRNSTNLIRLITRVIFIWFVKEKGLVPEKLFSAQEVSKLLKEFNKNSTSADYYRAILQNLFFGTLNQKMEDRAFAKSGTLEENRNEYGVKNRYRYREAFAIPEKQAMALFAEIPFLNGGLFDCLDKPDDGGKILYSDGFSRNPRKQAAVPDFLFFSDERDCDLNDTFGTKNKRYRVRGLINILSSYKFTITENTPLEEEIALDPELLGKVFENLLASYNPETQTTARKQTGSFYTPREIVNYMVDESLTAYFKSVLLGKTPIYNELGHAQTSIFGNEVKKGQLSLTAELSGSPWHGKEDELESAIKELLSYTSEAHSFCDHDVDNLINAIDSCKILDPACGSGAFPMGILHKLVLVLHKLDTGNERWKKRQVRKARQIDDADLRDRAVADIEEAFANNDLDYGRKLFLIENCIFGIDIQPIAVQIAKLRFFISLIVDERPIAEKANLGIRSLPNLETKFVAADTLIGLPQQIVLRNVEIDDLEAELKGIRHDYFSAKTRKEKLACQKNDKVLREKIAALLRQSGWDNKTAMQVAGFDPYDQNRAADFFDSEWMFGLKNPESGFGVFDIVIGNPPYVQIQKFSGKPEQEAWAKQKYATYTKTGDVYCLFYEKGFNLLRKYGVLSFITSNKWMRANYGKAMREFFSKNGTVARLIDFGDSPIFESATTYTNIVVWQKVPATQSPRAWDLSKAYEAEATLESLLEKQGAGEALFTQESYVIVANGQRGIKERIEEVGVPLKNWNIQINFGIKTGLNEAFIIDEDKKEELLRLDPKSSEILRPVLRGRDIKRYRADSANLWLLFVPWHFPLHNDSRIVGPSRKAEAMFRQQFPAVYAHLNKYRDRLASRNPAETGIRYEWYALQRCAATYYNEFRKTKIVYAEIVYDSAFSVDETFAYPDATTFIITGKNIKYLTALLNSRLSTYAFKSFYAGGDLRGNTFRYKKAFLDLLPVMEPQDQIQPIFETLVDWILFAKSHNLGSEALHFERLIDALVYELYFPAELATANCEILKHLPTLPTLTASMPDSKKRKTIEERYTVLSEPTHPISKAMCKLETIDEIQVIEGKK